MTVVTRFAPSPTGFLHIGGARTALFNWLFARRHNGKFLLRIEDTDRARSTEAAIDAIHEGLKWLELDWDGEAFYQFARADRHQAVAHELLERGAAYRCFTPAEELATQRDKARAEGTTFRYESPWRDAAESDWPKDQPYVVRIRAPREGEVHIADQVQGDVRIPCADLDDMVLLRSDGSPTYMLAVVVDDHDMGVTHVIRGDDHLTNAARQMLIYQAMDWAVPVFAHIPLIHGPDGAKLSKRHGALGVEAYRDMGYLPEAMRNYLLRLGWSHGDEEIIPTEQAIAWFGLDHVGKSPSRFDFAKLENLNGHYIREADNGRLVQLITPRMEALHGRLDEVAITRLLHGMEGLKQRAKTLNELAESAAFYIRKRPLQMESDKARALTSGDHQEIIRRVLPVLEAQNHWNQHAIMEAVKAWGEAEGVKLGDIAQPLRAALTGSHISPSTFEVLEVLGQEESLARIRDVC